MAGRLTWRRQAGRQGGLLDQKQEGQQQEGALGSPITHDASSSSPKNNPARPRTCGRSARRPPPLCHAHVLLRYLLHPAQHRCRPAVEKWGSRNGRRSGRGGAVRKAHSRHSVGATEEAAGRPARGTSGGSGESQAGRAAQLLTEGQRPSATWPHACLYSEQQRASSSKSPPPALPTPLPSLQRHPPTHRLPPSPPLHTCAYVVHPSEALALVMTATRPYCATLRA